MVCSEREVGRRNERQLKEIGSGKQVLPRGPGGVQVSYVVAFVGRIFLVFIFKKLKFEDHPPPWTASVLITKKYLYLSHYESSFSSNISRILDKTIILESKHRLPFLREEKKYKNTTTIPATAPSAAPRPPGSPRFLVSGTDSAPPDTSSSPASSSTRSADP